MPPTHPDFLLSSYSFPLPEGQIAQRPSPERTDSRLMVLNRAAGTVTPAHFADILHFLPENCLLIANNSRVIPARLFGKRPSGGRVEFLLLTPPPLLEVEVGGEATPLSATHNFDSWVCARAEGLLRSSKKAAVGERIDISPQLYLVLRQRGEFGRCMVTLHWTGDLGTHLQQLGELPLPPYIKRQHAGGEAQGSAVPPAASNAGVGNGISRSREGTGQDAGIADAGEAAVLAELDRERYQTVYAREEKAGSVAAPTAGLHFTDALRQALVDSGREWAEVTLYVGYGTFSPVRCEDIREHPMHAEYVELPLATVEAIARAKREGRAVIAVGTTSARVLEGVAGFLAKDTVPPPEFPLAPYTGWLNAFLYPGKPFYIVDGLLTNFHLPESSLLMLVSAFAGRERVLAAYAQAVDQGFRFFSYGDAMLIV